MLLFLYYFKYYEHFFKVTMGCFECERELEQVLERELDIMQYGFIFVVSLFFVQYVAIHVRFCVVMPIALIHEETLEGKSLTFGNLEQMVKTRVCNPNMPVFKVDSKWLSRGMILLNFPMLLYWRQRNVPLRLAILSLMLACSRGQGSFCPCSGNIASDNQ